MASQTIIIERNDDEWVTSYDIWAKRDTYPSTVGDGAFAGNLTIEPISDSATLTWTPPTDGTWYFGALSIYNRTPGIFYQLNGT